MQELLIDFRAHSRYYLQTSCPGTYIYMYTGETVASLAFTPKKKKKALKPCAKLNLKYLGKTCVGSLASGNHDTCNPRTWVQHLTSKVWATTSRGAAGLRCNMHAPSIAPSEITDAADRRIYLKRPKTQIEKN